MLADTFHGPDAIDHQIEFERAAAAFCYPYYEAAAEEDAARSAIWKGEPLPNSDRYTFYTSVLTPAASRDPYVYREVYRRTNMLTHPHAIFNQSDIVERANRAMQPGPDKTISAQEVLDRIDKAQATMQAAE